MNVSVRISGVLFSGALCLVLKCCRKSLLPGQRTLDLLQQALEEFVEPATQEAKKPFARGMHVR